MDRVILAGLIDSAETVAAYRQALGGANLTICRVEAPVATLHSRLRAREPGSVRTFLLDVAPRLDAEIAALALEHLTVDNGADRPIPDLAAEVLDHLGWLVGPGRR